MEQKKEVVIGEDYLKQVIDYVSSSLVGKMMKRFEVLEDKNAIKSSVKELTYEEFRNFMKILLAYKEGREFEAFQFKTHSQSK